MWHNLMAGTYEAANAEPFGTARNLESTIVGSPISRGVSQSVSLLVLDALCVSLVILIPAGTDHLLNCTSLSSVLSLAYIKSAFDRLPASVSLLPPGSSLTSLTDGRILDLAEEMAAVYPGRSSDDCSPLQLWGLVRAPGPVTGSQGGTTGALSVDPRRQ